MLTPANEKEFGPGLTPSSSTCLSLPVGFGTTVASLNIHPSASDENVGFLRSSTSEADTGQASPVAIKVASVKAEVESRLILTVFNAVGLNQSLQILAF